MKSYIKNLKKRKIDRKKMISNRIIKVEYLVSLIDSRHKFKKIKVPILRTGARANYLYLKFEVQQLRAGIDQKKLKHKPFRVLFKYKNKIITQERYSELRFKNFIAPSEKNKKYLDSYVEKKFFLKRILFNF